MTLLYVTNVWDIARNLSSLALNFYHPGWRPGVAITPITYKGQVSKDGCLNNGLREFRIAATSLCKLFCWSSCYWSFSLYTAVRAEQRALLWDYISALIKFIQCVRLYYVLFIYTDAGCSPKMAGMCSYALSSLSGIKAVFKSFLHRAFLLCASHRRASHAQGCLLETKPVDQIQICGSWGDFLCISGQSNGASPTHYTIFKFLSLPLLPMQVEKPHHKRVSYLQRQESREKAEVWTSQALHGTY